MSVSLDIDAPPQFDFHQTAHSHGWLRLAPYHWDEQRNELQYILQTTSGEVLRLRISEAEAGVRAHLPDCALGSSRAEVEIRLAVRRMLNLDWDLSEFYLAMRCHEDYDWLERERRGRILICPALWEDLAKVLLTTNCNWAQTVQMSGRLCQLGAAHPSLEGRYAFPTPQRIAAMDFDEFAAHARAGYRNSYLYELAQRIASGELDLESWHRLDSDGLVQAVKALKGFGDYAAGTIARMLGHFDKIAIDTACHSMFAALHNNGVKADTKAITAYYAGFGKWRGLVLWMDVMRHYEVVNRVKTRR